MKRTIIGFALLISATLTDIGILISASLLGAGLTEWDSDSGRMWSALVGNGMLLPFILAKVLWAVSIIILVKEYVKGKNENQ